MICAVGFEHTDIDMPETSTEEDLVGNDVNTAGIVVTAGSHKKRNRDRSNTLVSLYPYYSQRWLPTSICGTKTGQ
jgi:hypothetical protein